MEEHMAVPRTATSEDSRPTAHTPDWSAAGPPYRPVAVPFPDQLLWVQVIRHASCATSRLDPEDWFPVSIETGKARREAAAAIAVCTTCPVRAQCLTLSLRHWDIGQHGVWGGMVPAERMALRRLLRADATNAARNARPYSGPEVPRPRDQLTRTTQNAGGGADVACGARTGSQLAETAAWVRAAGRRGVSQCASGACA
jgi:WhiB family redox-sensing transcriptional regulator